MILPDVNVLLYAMREELPEYATMRPWLERVVAGVAPFALSELVLSGVLRVATHPRVYRPPMRLHEAADFVDWLRTHGRAVTLRPGPGHWAIFTGLCEQTGATGKLVADAYHAALAIEHRCTWVSTDRDFARFPGLRWRHPLDG